MKVFRLLLYVYIRLTLSFAAALTSDFLYSLKPRAIIEWTGGDTSPSILVWGDAKVNVPPLIAHLVKFLGHIFHLDKLDYCISGVTGV